ncbi:MAG: flagellin lysine-N-methylase [Dorea sp.]
MLYTIPDYYKEFTCTADACEDTCCAGWQIVIDKKSQNKYKKVQGDFRKRLLHSIRWREEVFKQDKEKRCAFLNENNLCDMYMALGPDSLCKTCRLYPRHIEEFEGVREISLSLSCPEVAKILLSRKEPVCFLDYEKDGEEEYEDFDIFLYSKLADARNVMFDILQDRSKSISVRSGLVLAIAHDMQGRIQRGELFACDEVLEKYQTEAAVRFLEKKCEEWKQDQTAKYLFAEENIFKLYELELLKESWFVALKETECWLYAYKRQTDDLDKSVETYNSYSEQFEKWMDEYMPEWDIISEQLLVYFIFTYFCGAVYDGRVYAKTQMAVYSLLVISEILKGRWLKNEKMLDMDDVRDVVYRYSRELEHSDKNLEKLEKMMEKDVWL